MREHAFKYQIKERKWDKYSAFKEPQQSTAPSRAVKEEQQQTTPSSAAKEEQQLSAAGSADISTADTKVSDDDTQNPQTGELSVMVHLHLEVALLPPKYYVKDGLRDGDRGGRVVVSVENGLKTFEFSFCKFYQNLRSVYF